MDGGDYWATHTEKQNVQCAVRASACGTASSFRAQAQSAQRARSYRQAEAQIARSIIEFGFNDPVLIDGNDQIIAGHGRVEAAKLWESI